jgi:hypothetical protein
MKLILPLAPWPTPDPYSIVSSEMALGECGIRRRPISRVVDPPRDLRLDQRLDSIDRRSCLGQDGVVACFNVGIGSAVARCRILVRGAATEEGIGRCDDSHGEEGKGHHAGR